MSKISFVNAENLPIVIARDGTWYWGTLEMKRKNIVQLLSSHLVKTGEHNYAIHLNNEIQPVQVEDVPFVITKVIPEAELKIMLNDERILALPPTEIKLKNDIPYCSLFWEYDTKFSRAAFWQIHYYFYETEQGYEVRYQNKVWKIV